jgi:hypothetical protein
MSDLDKARQTQLDNIQKKTGKSLDEVRELIRTSGLSKHGEIRAMLMKELGLGYGDANSLVHFALASDAQSAAEARGLSAEDVLAEIYAGPKASLRPIHDRIMAGIDKFGPFEIVPKKGYVSLRRKKQFAMLGPGTKGRFEVGLNMKGAEASNRLEAMPPGGMCQYKVFLSSQDEIDQELLGWISQAYAAAG